MVECLLMVQWVVRMIPPGGPIKLFLVPLSVPQLVQQLCTVWVVLYHVSDTSTTINVSSVSLNKIFLFILPTDKLF